YKLYSVEQHNQQQVDFLRELQQKAQDLDFWQLDRLVGSEARVLVPPTQLDSFRRTLAAHNLAHRELIHDFGRVQDDHLYGAKSLSSSEGLPLNKYLRYDEMIDYINTLARKYSGRVTVSEIGKSYEGRAIPAVTIRSPTLYSSHSNVSHPVVFIDAGIHAREWAAPAMAMYLISELVENASKNQDLLTGLTWTIVPIANPDGYEYSHEHERLWRKTRRPAGRNCIGVDGNRNYDFHWAEVGASNAPCAETYHGETSFSEPETRAIRDELLRLKGRCKFYLSLHTYGEYLLYPWGWTNDLPVGWEKIHAVAKVGARAIQQATGTAYTVGSSTNVLYAAAGGSDDYAFAVADVPISMTMELPGGGSAGFNPPPSRIEEIVKETFVGIRAMALEVARKYKLYSVEQHNQQQADFLRDLQHIAHDLDFWKLNRLVGSEAHVLVPPVELESFRHALSKQNLTHRELIADFERLQDDIVYSRSSSQDFPFTTYLRYNEMMDYINTLAHKHPDLMTVSEIGKSYEGRAIPAVTISFSTLYRSHSNVSKPVIFVDAGIHAREWAAPATALYLISELVANASKNQDLLTGLTWIIVPIVNPDGYEYSHEHERLWRKTRRPVGRNCYGTDGNRNFDFHWGEAGTSAYPCAETYHGERPFSEPETRAIRDELLRLRGRCKFYLTLHTYGEYLLYPWGWTSKLPVGWERIDAIAKVGARAIQKATGTTYTVGSSTNVLAVGAGGSDDYAFAVAKVPISMTMELSRGGSAGFNPPPSRIEAIVKETLVGIRAMALELSTRASVSKMSYDSTKLFQSYQSHKDIKQYLDNLLQQYSNKIEVFSRAESYEGREILTVRICPDVQQKRPVANRWCILIDAGIHAREWITVSVALFIVRQLLEKDEISAKSFRSFEWIILPLLNPDGYEYSREHNKMWRKTRRPLGPRNHRSCVGVDCNRNFNVAWTIGSTRFCSLLYRGERPFSERETKNVRDLFRKLRPACKFYLSLHSYAKAILYPRAYSRTLPRNWQMQHTIAAAGVEAMKKATGVRYRCGSASTVLNRPVGGSSIDYAHDIEKVPVALVMEVASKGFHPPEANIQRICEESWIGIGAMVNCLASSFRSALKGSGTLHLR
uniref:Peptidase M14 domain-containing protein n=1 Tax=Anopheles epiroticus TaxID=199890 RepID=A0A182PB01_9DIPT